MMVDVSLFLDHLDLDSVQFSVKSHRTFVRDNAHLFTGTWDEVHAKKVQFQNAVRYSVPRRLTLATPNVEWDAVKELFGDTPLTIRFSGAVVIGDKVEPNIVGIQAFRRPFALVNTWHSVRNPVAEKCNAAFFRWCTENSITQLELDERGPVLSDDAILDFCFGPHATDLDPRHRKARFQYSAAFVVRLLETNRKCDRKGSITMDLLTQMAAAPNFTELAPYRAGKTRRHHFVDVTSFLLPDEFDVKIDCSYRQWGRWNCRIEFYRPVQPSQ
ncbi:hypothetical protein AAVH_13418 [Aphelenchoides avenae]|nr:hypothetical protein AAVH_13418 [Aphelenchus avenae]